MAALASLVALGSIGPVAAFEPNSQTNEMQDWTDPQQPVGPGQRATADKKLVLAAQFAKEDAARANGEVTVAATTTESYLVGTWERQQVNYYYCGPAAIQVEADYVWNMGPDKVKWKQSEINANWTHTTTAGTMAPEELKGANGVLVGSPRASWPYWSYKPTSGADWFNKMKTDLVLTMRQIVNLKPWWYSSSERIWYYLFDWAGHQSTGGHWIVANGYSGVWDGTRGPNVRFDDSAAGYGGGTGTYWDNQYDMWQLILHHHDIVRAFKGRSGVASSSTSSTVRSSTASPASSRSSRSLITRKAACPAVSPASTARKTSARPRGVRRALA